MTWNEETDYHRKTFFEKIAIGKKMKFKNIWNSHSNVGSLSVSALTLHHETWQQGVSQPYLHFGYLGTSKSDLMLQNISSSVRSVSFFHYIAHSVCKYTTLITFSYYANVTMWKNVKFYMRFDKKVEPHQIWQYVDFFIPDRNFKTKFLKKIRWKILE